MHGGVLFNSRFAAMWRSDGYRDYLSRKSGKGGSAEITLRLLAVAS